MALVTATNIKDARSISGSALDTALADIATVAGAQVLGYLRRSVIEQAAISSEVAVSIGQPVLQLAEWPITSVSSLVEDGTSLTSGTHFDFPEPYASIGQLRRLSGTSPAVLSAWSTSAAGIVVGYTAGYAAASAPLVTIQRAALAQALLIWSHDPRSGDSRNQTSGKTYPSGGSVTYRGEAWSEIAIALLEPYRKFW